MKCSLFGFAFLPLFMSKSEYLAVSEVLCCLCYVWKWKKSVLAVGSNLYLIKDNAVTDNVLPSTWFQCLKRNIYVQHISLSDPNLCFIRIASNESVCLLKLVSVAGVLEWVRAWFSFLGF